MTRFRIAHYFFFLLFFVEVSAQDTDSVANRLTEFVHVMNNFSKNIPQEKVYLHFDNTGYYQGDHIWFKCYVVTSGLHQASRLSKTLYVELLNPGGEVIDKQILKLENGQCHGDFTLNRIPFYSGFYEIRAYTKYMLNFGEDVIFSRMLPVFDKPKEEGNFQEKNMQKYIARTFPMIRTQPRKEKKVNLKFFPEGGNLVQDVASQVAFEATDEFGNPIDITGTVVNKAKEEISRFSTIHNGRGIFTYTPTGQEKDKEKAIVDFDGKKFQFDMPAALPQGFVLTVDNVSYPDSIEVAIRKQKDTPAEMLGMAVISRGRLRQFFLIADDESARFKFDKTGLPSGVAQIVLFNGNGKILCDRLLFTYKDELLKIKAETGKKTYQPHELVDMKFTVTDKDENPVQAPFSLSVKDGTDGVEYKHNILTDLLLMSEIKGYVRDPSYYFEADDHAHRQTLDLLLMVQGWRRYSWPQMTGTEPFELKYLPEQGIETQGQE